ncbi:MAG TPA: GAF domain-containing sensor histidine kinase [Gemmatimonadaceae bacterium]|nr:GAF domain-containing sensor histidine kinase [Gemmatimonadaceae bacterium]
MTATVAFETASQQAFDALDAPDPGAFTRRARRLLAVTAELSNAAATADVARVVLGMGLGVVEASRGFIFLRSGTGLRLLNAEGYDSAILDRVNALRAEDDTPVTRSLRTGMPVYLSSVEEYRSTYPWAYEQFGAVSATQAHAALPLMHNGSVIGGLGLSFAQPTAFGAVDRTFTMLLAQIASGALARAIDFDNERSSRKEAELLAAAREEVLAVVAHDLRNPLNLISNTAQLLGELDPPPEKRRQLLAVAVRASRQMNRLIGDLLDVHRMQMGRLELQLRECDAAEIVQEVYETMLPAAEQRQVTICVTTAMPSLTIRADHSRVVQALGNLVANAVKFTPPGGRVCLAVRATPQRLLFLVEDTGPGISAENRRHLFEKFWQAQRDRRGVGLGLAIVKGIAEAHQGRVLVRSMDGQGSTFGILLPRCPCTIMDDRC